MSSNNFGPRASPSNIQGTLSGAYQYLVCSLVVLVCVLQSIPKFFHDLLQFGGMPVYAYVYGILALVVIYIAFQCINRVNVWVFTAAAVLIIGAIIGASVPSSNFTSSVFLMDVAAFSALFVGILISNTFEEVRVKHLVLGIFLIALAGLIGTELLIRLGLIRSLFEYGRVFDISMYYTASLAAIFMPVAVFVCADYGHRWLGFFSLAVMVAASMVFAEMSATRSVMIISFVSVIFTLVSSYVGKSRMRDFVICGVIFLFLGFIALVLVGGGHMEWLNLENLLSRVEVTGWESMDRLDEAGLMFEALNNWWWTGLGLGSGFYSNVLTIDSPDGFTGAIHIGLLMPIFKLGVIGGLLFVIYPLVQIVMALFLRKTSSYDRACYLSMLVFMVQATLSGGYHYTVLLMVGLLWRTRQGGGS